MAYRRVRPSLTRPYHRRSREFVEANRCTRRYGGFRERCAHTWHDEKKIERKIKEHSGKARAPMNAQHQNLPSRGLRHTCTGAPKISAAFIPCKRPVNGGRIKSARQMQSLIQGTISLSAGRKARSHVCPVSCRGRETKILRRVLFVPGGLVSVRLLSV